MTVVVLVVVARVVVVVASVCVGQVVWKEKGGTCRLCEDLPGLGGTCIGAFLYFNLH